MPEEPPDGETSYRTCLLRRLWRLSGFMKATAKPGDCHESWFSFYAQGSSRGKSNVSTHSDRSVVRAFAASFEAGIAVGGAHRGDDAALTPTWQKRRWRTWLALGCIVICTIGSADADQGLRFASDGRVCGREWGGTRVHGSSPL
jgi:hypothetical protein